MGRSVSYLDNAEAVFYFPFESQYSFEWDDLLESLRYSIQKKYSSYFPVTKWEDETQIILQNRLCNIGISEYCGLVSLSIAPNTNDYDDYIEVFAIKHAQQIEKGLAKILDNLRLNRYNKIGTFSNGEAVFELAK